MGRDSSEDFGMNNKMKPSFELKDKLKIIPYDCVIVDNMRIIIKTKINENSDKRKYC